jgi:hypothetical protein
MMNRPDATVLATVKSLPSGQGECLEPRGKEHGRAPA